MKCPRCEHENRPDAKYCDECGTPAPGADLAKPHADLKDENEGLRRSLTEALEQQTAAAEILRVISSTPTDLQPVFAAMAARAARLCDAFDATIFQVDGDVLRLVAHEGPITPDSVLPLTPGTVGGRVVRERRAIHVADMQAETETYPLSSRFARDRGFRAILSVPLLHGAQAIGLIAIRRAEVRPFTDRQVELVKAFADQAVIAIENVRLFTELEAKNAHLTEALEQQTATAEILRVISSSPTDVQPVLDAVVRSAARLCEAYDAWLGLREGEHLRIRVHHGPIAIAGSELRPMHRGRVATNAILDRRTIHVHDLAAAGAEFPVGQDDAVRAGHRTTLGVPLMREGQAIGVILIRRSELRPFTDSQVTLLETFADQAVIAIENVRLFTELQEKNKALTQAHAQVSEALEQQTATSEILAVISQSPTDVQPVFDTIVCSAERLCGGLFGALVRFDGELVHFAAQHNFSPEALAETKRIWPTPPTRSSGAGRAILERAIVQIPDIELDPEYGLQRLSRAVGHRSSIYVPMLRDDTPIGVIIVARAETGLFSDNHIALLKTFADQAVIAIENVRLFKELQGKNQALTEAHAQVSEALERQTATSEILRVISRSQTDVQPVFDTIVQSAVRLCAGLFGALFQFDGELLHMVAHHNYTPEALEAAHGVYPARPSRDHGSVRAIVERAVVHIPDVELDPEHQHRELRRAIGQRSGLFVPMLREGDPIGVIMVARPEPGPFSNNEIELLKTFADQAVIAIENVRLFTELQEKNRALTQAHAQVTEALEQQMATAEILRVISSSPTDVQPVFDAIIRSAVTLCDASFGGLHLFDGEQITLDAHSEIPEQELEILRTVFPFPPGPNSLMGRAILDRSPVQMEDVRSVPGFHSEAIQSLTRYRTGLAVPMLRNGIPIGGLTVWRGEVRPFTDRQIELIVTFADQAVIAIENVRLFTELQASNRDLTESLEQQTATSEILRVISSSPTDVQPVFDTIVQSAARLCHAANAGVFLTDGRTLDLPANYGSSSPEALATVRAQYPRPVDLETTAGVAILTRSVIQVPDTEEPSAAEVYTRRVGRLLGVRSMVAVPMMLKGEVVGAINLSRQAAGRFSDAEVELLKTFADQAVIAIENVRLFKELEARNRDLTTALDQQTATGEILRVISSSPTDVQPVFETIAANAVRLCGAVNGAVFRFDGELIHLAAYHNVGGDQLAATLRVFPVPPGRRSVTARAISSRAVVHVEDLRELLKDPEYAHGAIVEAGFRTVLAVPMLREGLAIGAINVTRMEVRPFSADQIALLKTFADQAVIAIENVRLFTELQARTADLTRSVGELRALGAVGQALSSTLDVDVVLDTIVTRANDLIGADGCTIFEYDEGTEQFHLRATRNLEPRLVELARGTPLRKGDQGILGQLPIGRQAVQVPDITAGSYSSPISDALIEAGYRAVVAVPLIREDHLIGALTMNRKTPGEFPAETIELLQTFATQSALAIQNARLFREIEQTSRELEAASRHKSEFLANMSHELRTPLNAVIGFSEVLTERMFGELNEKQDEYLKDIHASGQHLLSLINDILDLSKIEAGKMELELSDFDLPMTIDNALMLVRERAARRSIALNTAVDERVGQVHADERKLRQVLLNLLSNAIKFTPEGGRIHVEARSVNESIEVSVTDTGVGIAPKDQEAVFEEFRQVGTADKKVEGTGLGLALSRKFVELHGGKIWVESQVGEGSTFTFTVPVRRGE